MNKEKENRHMTLDERTLIQECFSKGMTYIAIGRGGGKVIMTFRFVNVDLYPPDVHYLP